MLAHEQLPPGLIDPALDVLRSLLSTEQDFIRLVVELIIDLRDKDDEEEVEDLLACPILMTSSAS